MREYYGDYEEWKAYVDQEMEGLIEEQQQEEQEAADLGMTVDQYREHLRAERKAWAALQRST